MYDYSRAFRNLRMPPKRYAMVIGLPMVGGSLVLGALLYYLYGDVGPEWLAPLIPLGVFGLGLMGAIMWPIAVVDRRRIEINNAIPFFMTHFGALSTSNTGRAEIIQVLSEKKEYKALAEELANIYGLVTNWNLSLPQACRQVSKSTPSQIFSDFLERLAHALDTGQELDVFLRNEQSVVMKEYATVYETQIYQVETWKDIYSSVIMSGVFFVIFAIIMPILITVNQTQLLWGILFFFMLMEGLLLMVLKFRVPAEHVWHRLPILTPERLRLRVAASVSVAAFLLFTIVLLPLFILPVPVVIALAATPMGAAGVYIKRLEDRVKRREENYPAFIRSVGAAAAARGGSLHEVLRKIKYHNFGPLTAMVQNLYARLTWRLFDAKAWKRFSAESGSDLINSFNDMFVEGVSSGGKPDQVGEIISDNVVRILNLRRGRYSTAGTFRGLLIGITASMAFVLFIGVGILGVLGDLFTGVAATGGDLNPVDVNIGVSGIEFISAILFLLLVLHALVAMFALKMVDGGMPAAGFGTFALMVWMSAVLAVASVFILDQVFSVGGPG